MKKYNLSKVILAVFAFLLLVIVVMPSKSLAYSYTISLVPNCTSTIGTSPQGISCSSMTMIKFSNRIDTRQERINVQKVLNKVLVPTPSLTTDGVFGAKTILAIKTLQTLYGLTADGNIGIKTRSVLEQAQIDYYKGDTPTPTCSGSATQTCTITNGTGTQSRTCTNGTWSTYGTCTPTSCNTGYQISGNTCVVTPPTTDTTLPSITAFNIPTTASSLTVSVTSFTATDNVGVTGYLLTESSTKPSSTVTSWSTAVPMSYTFTSSGSKTLYAWAKDAAGNISATVSRSVTITLPTTTCSGSTTQTCTITNGTGTQARTCTNGTWSTYGTCTPTSCNTGYQISGNTCVVATASTGNTYYISNSGNDSNNGTTLSTPWKTIAKVNSATFKAGDSILFERGGTWRETLTMFSSGNANNYIKFEAYGTGEKPKIYGSSIATGWTNQGGNIWKSNNTFTNPNESYTGGVFFENFDKTVSWGNPKTSTGSLTTQRDWVWSSNYIYIYSTSNPGTNYFSIEVAQRINVISLNYKGYLSIDGLDIRYSTLAGIKDLYGYEDVDGLIIQNCHIGYIGAKGSTVGYGIESYHSFANINHNEIHETGRRGMSIYTLGATGGQMHDVIIEYNTVYNTYHTGIDVAAIDSATVNNVYVRNNFIYEDLTQDGVGYGNVDHISVIGKANANNFVNVYVYDNIIKNSVGSGLLLNRAENVHVYNNVFYGRNQISDIFSSQIYVEESSDCEIKNNIFYNNANAQVSPTNGRYQAFLYFYNVDWSTINFDVDYNLYYNTDPSNVYAWTLSGNGGGHLVGSWSTYRSKTGWDTHSPTPQQDPLFTSSDDYHLKSNSPANGKGVTISGVIKDYDGKTYSNPPSIGAYEAGSVLGASKYNFTENMKYGDDSNDVFELQKLLVSAGYLEVTPNGTFGPATLVAVKGYQEANDLTPDGIVGLKTREILNK
jgi:peptidoglycan hydrolase-like protein with peptidoglycan-binding domain